jgi:hypothetical protein
MITIDPSVLTIFMMMPEEKEEREEEDKVLKELVSRLGFEPRTLALKARTLHSHLGLVLRRFPRFSSRINTFFGFADSICLQEFSPFHRFLAQI